MSKNTNDLLKRAARLFGDEEYIKLMEECAELTQATAKFLIERNVRGNRITENRWKVAEEMADVSIMIQQVTQMLHVEILVEDYRNAKLSRLEKRVEAKEKEVENTENNREHKSSNRKHSDSRS